MSGSRSWSVSMNLCFGKKWRDSPMIGELINTRGLMELVVLLIGYDPGMLSTKILTMR